MSETLPDSIGQPRKQPSIDQEIQEIGVAARGVLDRVNAAIEAGGYPTREAYLEGAKNAKNRVLEESEAFLRSSLLYLLYIPVKKNANGAPKKNDEMPHGKISCTCADGRIGGPEMFVRDPRLRFAEVWHPAAGLLMFPRIGELMKEDDPVQALANELADPTKKAALFEQVKMLFEEDIKQQLLLAEASVLAAMMELHPDKVQSDVASREVVELAQFLQEQSGAALRERYEEDPNIGEKILTLYRSPKRRFPLSIELQSHSDPHDNPDDPHHGCGAHGSDKIQAIETSALDGLLIQAFIEEEFAKDKDDIQVALTHQSLTTGSAGSQ